MMEYIISQDSAPPGDLYEDETYCTRGLCAHPSCWASHVRQTRGFKRYVSSAAGSSAEWKSRADEEVSDDGLATQKVLNMLDEYGSSAKDLYPSEHKGLPAHKQRHKPDINNQGGKFQPPKTPTVSAAFEKVQMFDDMFRQPHRDSTVKQVEVQEVFDLEELSQNWDSTFIPKPVYVWVPGKTKRRGRKKKMKSSADETASSVRDAGSMRDITNDMLPRGYTQPYTAPLQSTRQATIPRSKSPIPTGGQPYHNVGQTPKDRMRFQVIMNELKDLPRPFVIEVLEKARDMDSKEDVLMLMERYLKTMRKSDWELSMVTGKVLQQQRLNSKILQHSERLPAVNNNKMYKLDEVQYDDSIDADMTAIPADIMQASMGGTNKYKTLPGIGEARGPKKKNTVRVHVSTTTQESVKPFQYKKKPDLEFCLGPTRSLSASRPDSERTTHSARQPTIPGADMSVLYDQESIERNANNNANAGNVKGRMGGGATHAESRSSSVLPKAPAGTPYSPKTPYKDKQGSESKLEGQNPSPEGVALEVIQEMTVVDEFTTNQNRLGRETDLTTKSVIESRVVVSPTTLTTRRVVSANTPRVQMDNGKRARSASASMALMDRSSIGQQDQEVLAGSQRGRVTTSRLEVVSTTSNWPNVDEEALLREQATPDHIRISSAAASKHSRDSLRKSVPVSTPAREGEPAVRTIVVDMPPMKRLENSPAPPPPSPEPANKSTKPKTSEEGLTVEDSEVNVGADETVAGTTSLPNESASEELRGSQPIASNTGEVPNKESQSEHQPDTVLPSTDNSAPPDCQITAEPQHSPSNKQSGLLEESQPNEQTVHQSDSIGVGMEQTGGNKEVDQSQQGVELEEKLTKDLELNIDRRNMGDSLSLVPDKLYDEMDLEREITLSALPPSVLNTPELSALNNKPPLPQIADSQSEEKVPSPDVAAVMNQDDQGGLSGQ